MAQHTSVGRPSTVGEFLAGVAGRSFTLALLGDVVLSGTQSAHDAWGSLLPLLLASDVRVCSLECAIAPARTQCGSALCRTQAVAAATVLSAARFQAVACANDHALDRGLDGMESTLSALSASGIACAGLGSNAAAACGAARFEVSVPGDIELLRVSLLAFADLGVSRGGEWAARNHHIGGIAVLDPADADSALVLQQAIALERAAGAELIIVAPHWGASDASQVRGGRSVEASSHKHVTGAPLNPPHTRRHPPRTFLLHMQQQARAQTLSSARRRSSHWEWRSCRDSTPLLHS